MRLLVLDGSRVLPRILERLVPADVEIESAATFDEASAVLSERPPGALIATLGPADLPWRKIQRLCREHQPRIPVLFESCVDSTSGEAGLDELDADCSFLAKPYHARELKRHVDRLVERARRASIPVPTAH